MKVAIVHYHLRAGGVTRVIDAQSRALRLAGIEHVILSGTPAAAPSDLPVTVVPALDYLASPGSSMATDLLHSLRIAAHQALGQSPDLWHLHNPTLGKHPLFPSLLEALAFARTSLVLHVHDFAEDGRPREYRSLGASPRLYPLAPQIRYVTINSRDRRSLLAAGAPAEHTLHLPNAVEFADPNDPLPAAPTGPPTVLYPVRGIGRKNLGEFCLLAALAPCGTPFALSLAPENPRWQPVYHHWDAVAKRHRLPTRFGVVDHVPPAPGVAPTYRNWLAHSSHLLTTSVAEGFGLAFLEPLALAKPLFGRNLPEITIDFKNHGTDLGDLYDRILLPGDWIDSADLFRRLTDTLHALAAAYQVPLPRGAPDRIFESLKRDGFFDFGNLPVDLQIELLSRALHARSEVMIATGDRLLSASAWLADTLARSAPRTPSSTLAPYSIPRYAEQLTALYQDLRHASSATPTWLDRSALLHQFFTPLRFHFLRS